MTTITNLRKQQVAAQDSYSIDAFGRWRVSSPYTIFDSKQVNDAQPLFWDDQETSGSGTSTAHSVNEAATTISVGATTAGTRVRQTFQRFNYQPGKSQEVIFTFSEFDTTTGITKRAGYFDGNNGIFLESAEGTVNIVRRSKVTGSVVDTKVAQSSWNIDKMDGSGPSGVTIDFTKAQIGFIDAEWLGVGRVRVGFVIDGNIFYVHQFLNANNLTSVYMSTANLPVRYEISNDGNGAADDFVHICSSVISEGGFDPNGILFNESTGGTHIDANSADTIYAVIGIRLKSTHLGATINLVALSMIAETNDDFEWIVKFNPVVAGTFTYNDKTNSACQTALGATANTVTGGSDMLCGFSKQSTPASSVVPNAVKLGAAIDGTPDEIVLCVRPLSANADFQAALNWREL